MDWKLWHGVESYVRAYGISMPQSETDLKSFGERILQLETKIKMARGGIDTGGGTLVKTQHRIGLLDLYLYNSKNFESSYVNIENIIETNAFKKLGIELLTNPKNKLITKVERHLKRWQVNSPLIVSQILLALKYLPFYYVKGSLKSQPFEYFLPVDSAIKSSSLKLAALFDEGIGVYMGFDDLKTLPESHQMALVIHECLRLVNFTGNYYFSNKQIQELTAELINEPENYSVDRVEYLEGEILLDVFKFIKFISEVKIFASDKCKDYLFQSPYCLIDIENNIFEKNLEYLSDGFGDLYLKHNLSPTRQSQLAMNQAYLLMIEGQNMQIKGILKQTIYLKKYLELRSRFMQLDALIESENSM